MRLFGYFYKKSHRSIIKAAQSITKGITEAAQSITKGITEAS